MRRAPSQPSHPPCSPSPGPHSRPPRARTKPLPSSARRSSRSALHRPRTAARTGQASSTTTYSRFPGRLRSARGPPNEAVSRSEQCGARPYSFVVHGLWPQYERGFPEFCQQPAPRLDRNIVSSMLDLMPAPRSDLQRMGQARHLLGAQPARVFRQRSQGAGAGKDPRGVYRAAAALTVSPDEVEEAFVQGESRAHARGYRGDLRQPTAQRGPHLLAARIFNSAIATRSIARACRRDKLTNATGARVHAALRSATALDRLLRRAALPGVREDKLSRADELPPRLPCRQFRRCAQARRARAHPRASARKSRRRFASSIRMRAPAFTISPGRRRRAAGEWRDGIARLLAAPIAAPSASAARALSRRGRRRSIRRPADPSIPARPQIARAFLRPQDRLIACELEPNAAATLARNLARRPARQSDRDRRLDRAQRLCAAEGAARTGAGRSAVRAGRRIRAARARRSQPPTANGPTGIYLLWYPIKEPRAPRRAGAATARGRGIAKTPARRTHARLRRPMTNVSAAAG